MRLKTLTCLIFSSFVSIQGGSSERLSFEDAKMIVDRECDKIQEEDIDQDFILGGTDAALNEFPHMVALGYDRGGDGKLYSFECGGSVLSPSYVLTAAHCIVTFENVKPSIIRAGVAQVKDGERRIGTDFDISETITHPNYTRGTKYHDIALLRLSKPLSFSDALDAVCLHTSIEDPSTPLVVAGWGTTLATKKAPSEILLKAELSVVNISVCGESYQNWRKLPKGIVPEQLCAGDLSGLSDACQGDSGGPLLVKDAESYKLVGVTSFGRGCGSPAPGVYTRVARYLPWIVGHVWPNYNTIIVT